MFTMFTMPPLCCLAIELRYIVSVRMTATITNSRFYGRRCLCARYLRRVEGLKSIFVVS